MKKNIGFIILSIVLLIIFGFIVFIIVSKQNINKQTFNIKVGDVLTFDDYDTEVTVMHIASTLCKSNEKCFDEGEIELSLKVAFDDEVSNYTLKTKSNPKVRIKNSNNYLMINYKDDKISIDVKNKTEI